MKKRIHTLYNLIFPIWLLWLIPSTWIIVLPLNFIIDLLVITITMKILKIDNIKSKAKTVIWRVWFYGFIADFIGTATMFMANVINFNYETKLGKWWYENITNAVSYNPFENMYAFLWVTICVIITATFIYLFNYKLFFKVLDINSIQKKKIALSLAIFTAPYLFYLPTICFF